MLYMSIRSERDFKLGVIKPINHIMLNYKNIEGSYFISDTQFCKCKGQKGQGHWLWSLTI